MFSTFRKLTHRMTLPALILPAMVVTLASLLALISTVITSAASQPGDLLYSLRKPTLEFQLALIRDPDERAAIELKMGPALPDAGAAPGEVFESTDDDGGNMATGQEVNEDRSGADDGGVDVRGDGSTGQGDEGATGEQVNGDDSGGDGDDEINGGDGSTGQGGNGEGSGGNGSGDSSEGNEDDDSDGDGGDHSGPDESDEGEEDSDGGSDGSGGEDHSGSGGGDD